MPTNTAPVGVIAPVIATIADNVAPWLAEDADVTAVVRAAAIVAGQLADGPIASVVIEPGDGWSYKIIVGRPCHPSIPGNLLIALPEYHECLLLNFVGNGHHMPSYVAEKLRSADTARVGTIAAFATLLDHLLAP